MCANEASPLVCCSVLECVSTTLVLLSRELPIILLLLLRPTMYASHRLACVHGMLAVSSLQTRRLLKAAGEGAPKRTLTTWCTSTGAEAMSNRMLTGSKNLRILSSQTLELMGCAG